VADALAWYGSATVDQLALELDLSHAERPALLAALEFWVARGEASAQMRPSRAQGACAGGCGGRSCSTARPVADMPRADADATPVFTWAGKQTGS
jgi:hypothetical protein